MTLTRRTMMVSLAALLAGCGQPSKFKSYNGPEVTNLIVAKKRRRMWLMHNDTILRRYRIALGFAPKGDKTVEGDGKTPEGTYFIDRRNANSRFHLSLGISYPNAQDRAEAARLGQKPGGDIFIHGRGPRFSKARGDWTWGCIAVDDDEIEEIYAMVRNGTRIDILP
ncbi:murein L,D-transpeptidase family protein [Nereida sp. MMG025]|uniref:L,D-transpeptidase family protein n=1 Tax=Nereida sp. MMG025 TaxID=2909981 RepID=UPI001EFF8EFA|nr:L,D-transpeptidase family protein [Nereida sp. MMG025]MCF6444594.1 L,D-transpeptidase family protein [Nereida sp. MMG025]